MTVSGSDGVGVVVRKRLGEVGRSLHCPRSSSSSVRVSTEVDRSFGGVSDHFCKGCHNVQYPSKSEGKFSRSGYLN